MIPSGSVTERRFSQNKNAEGPISRIPFGNTTSMSLPQLAKASSPITVIGTPLTASGTCSICALPI